MRYLVLVDLRPHLHYLADPDVPEGPDEPTDIVMGKYRLRLTARFRVRWLKRDVWGQTLFENFRIIPTKN